MIWSSGWELASAVSNAGGLGLIGSGSMDPQILCEHICKCRAATDKPFGVNIPLIFSYADDFIKIVIEEKVPIVFTSAGNPGKYTAFLKEQGIKVVHVIANVKFAVKCEQLGVDAIVAEGFEAGGHNGREETTTMVLIPMIRKAVSIPLIAAGGIATGRGMLAAMALGAEGVQIGSRFVASEESSAHPAFKQKVIEAKDGDTQLSLKRIMPVRIIKNKFFTEADKMETQGARVMFVKNNFEGGYVNGTLGKVIEFEMDAPIILTTRGKRIKASPVSWSIEEEGKVKAEITQVPLRLAWAITVHKSQGMSLDAVEVDLSKSFERGMGYVALSRVRTLGGLKLLGINNLSLQVHEEVSEFDQSLQTFSETAVEALRGMKSTVKERIQQEFISKNTTKEKQADQKVSTYEETRKLVLEKLSIKDMAKKREMVVGTIISHLETLCDERKLNPENDLKYLKPEIKRFKKMESALEKVLAKTGAMKLSATRDVLGRSFNFEEIRIARLFVKK